MCVTHVTEALHSVPGVQSVKVDLYAGVATVEHEASMEALIAAVEGEGYEVPMATTPEALPVETGAGWSNEEHFACACCAVA
jgi:copper chaperone